MATRGVTGFLAAALALSAFGEAHAAGPTPFTKGPYVQSLTATSAEIRVEVDPPAPVSIDFGDAGGLSRIDQKEVAAFHVFALTGLLPRTLYRVTAESGSATKAASFTTAPVDTTDAPVHFLIYGDNRTDDSAHASVVRAMVSDPADFFVHTGDFVENGGIPMLWQRFFDVEAPLLGTTCVFATIGNHELADKEATYYLRYFGPLGATTSAAAAPSLRRTFRWGYLRFFMLSGLGEVGEEKKWLDDELAKSDGEANVSFRIAVTHYGPWSSGPHGSNRQLHNTGIVDALRKHHVSLVVSGHDHIYERGDSEGMPYLVTGGGGAPPYEQREKLKSTRAFDTERHFIDVAATPNALHMSAIRTDGSKIDDCILPKDGSGWACDKSADDAGTAKNSSGSAPATPTSSTPDTAKSSCACDLADPKTTTSKGATTASRGAVAALFMALFLLRRRRYARF